MYNARPIVSRTSQNREKKECPLARYLNFKGTVHICMYVVTRQGNGNAHRLRTIPSGNILAQKSRQLELASLLGRARPILEKNMQKDH